MTDAAVLAAILDSLQDPLLFADTEHRIWYMNQAAIEYYREGENLIGRSLLDCHNERSQLLITDILKAMRAGEEERLISESDVHRVYMRAVRDGRGRLLGYYERYEPLTGRAGDDPARAR